jgi:hypothetical protein
VGFLLDGVFAGSDENSQFDKFARSKFGRAKRGPEGRRKSSAGVRYRDVPHNLSRRAIHKKTPQSGVFLS